MNVRAVLLASISLACYVPSIQATERYAFRVAEGTQALAGENLPSNMAQLAGQPMMVLVGIDGTHWRWILNGCGATLPCEFRIDDRGGRRVRPEDAVGASAPTWDVGLTRIDSKEFRLRCLRTSCLIRHRANETATMTTTTLARGKSISLPVGSVIDLQLTDDGKP